MDMQIVNAVLAFVVIALQIATLRQVRRLKRAQAADPAGSSKRSGFDRLLDRRDGVPDPEVALVVEVQASGKVTEEVVRRLKAAWEEPVRIFDPATDSPMGSMYGGRSIAGPKR